MYICLIRVETLLCPEIFFNLSTCAVYLPEVHKTVETTVDYIRA